MGAETNGAVERPIQIKLFDYLVHRFNAHANEEEQDIWWVDYKAMIGGRERSISIERNYHPTVYHNMFTIRLYENGLIGATDAEQQKHDGRISHIVLYFQNAFEGSLDQVGNLGKAELGGVIVRKESIVRLSFANLSYTEYRGVPLPHLDSGEQERVLQTLTELYESISKQEKHATITAHIVNLDHIDNT